MMKRKSMQCMHSGEQKQWRQKGRVVYTEKTGRRRGPCQEQQGPQHERETCTRLPRAAANPSTRITMCPTSTNSQNVSRTAGGRRAASRKP
ncbi:Melanoma-associated antigen B4 [Clarias magur]|uniref:Melanoma-associated antigen B4 n=1 Tax=Clarias magur TaxID=1594786 RepID=A0A8J4UT43_CLAMG|nr:Melanoma-associated antigen B4 [Clarias magur]